MPQAEPACSWNARGRGNCLAATPDNPAAANPAAANAGAAVAGAPGEAAGGGDGKNAQSEITGAVGSIEYVIQSLIVMAKSGNYDGVDNIIARRPRDSLPTSGKGIFLQTRLKPSRQSSTN